MRRLAAVALLAALLAGCEGLNDVLVRGSLMNHELSEQWRQMMSDGYRRKMEGPLLKEMQRAPAPMRLDQG